MNASRFQTSIPLLDLARFEAGEAGRAGFLAELRDAARQVGFFYLTGHGIEPALLDGLMKFCEALFRLARD